MVNDGPAAGCIENDGPDDVDTLFAVLLGWLGAGVIESVVERSLKCCMSPTVLESRRFFCAATTFGGGGVITVESRLPLLKLSPLPRLDFSCEFLLPLRDESPEPLLIFSLSFSLSFGSRAIIIVVLSLLDHNFAKSDLNSDMFVA